MKIVALCLFTALLSTGCSTFGGKKCCSKSCDKKVSCCKEAKKDCNEGSCSKKKS
jgi:hypothetical protein